MKYEHEKVQYRLEQFFDQMKLHIEGTLSNKKSEIWSRCYSFFNELHSRLEAERKLTYELNRHLAHKFNVLEFLRDDEYGLSRIIASFLNPRANHGQGPYFLSEFYKLLQLDWNLSDANMSEAEVVLEKEIENQRRIDIYIQVRSEVGKCCIAIENKPYAEDQVNQVRDYLEHLRHSYSSLNDNYLLIYLSGFGRGPAKHSLSRDDLLIHKEHFVVMPYCILQEDTDDETYIQDEVEDYWAPQSLVGWLAECRAHCSVDRLRWFLRDIENFCLHQFGVQPMISDSEKSAVQEFLFANPDHLMTAQAIAESWSEIENRISDQFLKQIHKNVQGGLHEECDSDLCIDDSIQSGGRNTVRKILIYRNSWKKYSEKDSVADNSRITVFLSSDGRRGYFLGVSLPVKVEELEKAGVKGLANLASRLNSVWPGKIDTESYLVWKYFKDEMKSWDQQIPKLFQECNEKDGEITKYYVDSIIDLATKAIPIIDEFEDTTT